MENNELNHWGIKGQKWGLRRFQNKDGSYTDAGKKRRNQQEEPHEDYTKAHDKKSVKSMSDAELRARINRLQMEKQLKDLSAGEVSAGRKFVTDILAGAGKEVAKKYVSKYMNDAAAQWVNSNASKAAKAYASKYASKAARGIFKAAKKATS